MHGGTLRIGSRGAEGRGHEYSVPCAVLRHLRRFPERRLAVDAVEVPVAGDRDCAASPLFHRARQRLPELYKPRRLTSDCFVDEMLGAHQDRVFAVAQRRMHLLVSVCWCSLDKAGQQPPCIALTCVPGDVFWLDVVSCAEYPSESGGEVVRVCPVDRFQGVPDSMLDLDAVLLVEGCEGACEFEVAPVLVWIVPCEVEGLLKLWLSPRLLRSEDRCWKDDDYANEVQ